jgi:hypothetical protein
MSDQKPASSPNLPMLLGAVVSLFTIVGTILGVGWKLAHQQGNVSGTWKA